MSDFWTTKPVRISAALGVYALLSIGLIGLIQHVLTAHHAVVWTVIGVGTLFAVWWQYLAVPSMSFTHEKSVHNFVPAFYALVWVAYGTTTATWIALGQGVGTIAYRWSMPRLARRFPHHPLVRLIAFFVNQTPAQIQRMGQSWIPYVQNSVAALLTVAWFWWWRAWLIPHAAWPLAHPDLLILAGVSAITLNNYWGIFLLSPLLPPADQEHLWHSGIWRDSLPVSVVESVLALLLIGGWPTWHNGIVLLMMLVVHRMASQLTFQRRLLEQEYHLRQAQEAARTDPLTGLPNRRALEEYARQVTTEGLPAVVALVDIDRFKQVNDTWGHDVGDIVLKTVAGRLQQACRTTRAMWPDRVGRWGGEEFVLILPQMPDTVVPHRLETIRTTLSQPIQLPDGRILALTCSLGAVSVATHPWDLTEAVKQADNGLYTAKAQGRNQGWWHGVTISTWQRLPALTSQEVSSC